MFGMSFVYVIFQDGNIGPYWRCVSRVVEYLAKVQGKLPEGVTPQIGPDATSVGWCSSTRSSTSGKHDLQGAPLVPGLVPALLAPGLEGVAEVASVGGFEKETIQTTRRGMKARNVSVGRRRGGARRQRRGRRPGHRDGAARVPRPAVAASSRRRMTSTRRRRDGRARHADSIRDVADVTIGGNIRRGLVDPTAAARSWAALWSCVTARTR